MPSLMIFLSLAAAASPRPVAAFCSVSRSLPICTTHVALRIPSWSSTRLRMKDSDGCTSSDRARIETSKNEEANEDGNSSKACSEVYAEAWHVRTRLGHHAAVPYYKQILSSKINSLRDTSAATRIAASETSLQMLDLVGRSYSSRGATGRGTPYFDVGSADVEWENDIAKLRNLLEKSHYNHSTIRQSIFNLPVGCLTQQHHLNYDIASLEKYTNNYPMGPIYARPLQHGQNLDVQSIISYTSASSSQETYKSSLQCLTALFLLASCIPKALFLRSVFDGEETLDLLLRLGLVFLFKDSSSDEDDDNTEEEWITPLVHLFPLEIPELIKPLETSDDLIQNDIFVTDSDETRKDLVIMTDMHPDVLGLTSIPDHLQSNGDSGSGAGEEDGMVMYIGPDSLALVHHFHANFLQFWNAGQPNPKSSVGGSGVKGSFSSDDDTASDSFSKLEPFKVLDLCTGSGIQALATLSMLQMLPSSEYFQDGSDVMALAVAVDINRRALRFTEFNSILNGFGVVSFETGKDSTNSNYSRMKICTVHSDLISAKVLSHDSVASDDMSIESTDRSLVGHLLGMFRQKSSICENEPDNSKFDVLLANPPFIPVPPEVSDNRVLSVFRNLVIHDNTPQYGLFSSGGENGEECLRTIIQMSPALLRPGAMAAIVSEFMNPPSMQSSELDQVLCSKIETWWNYSFGSQGASPPFAKGMLFTNEHALSSATYAQRRAFRNDHNDFLLWNNHLEEKGINSVSPGLLFLRVFPDEMGCQTQPKSRRGYHSHPIQSPPMLVHQFVRKTTNGSIWTPHNFNAVESIRMDLLDLFHSEKT